MTSGKAAFERLTHQEAQTTTAEDMNATTTTATASATQEREIVVNGAPLVTDAGTLLDLIDKQGFGDVKVATAVNGDFVAARLRAETALRPGDRIEILTVRQGG
jgi:sulfur carrier protein